MHINTQNRYDIIDILRGVAILLVVVRHTQLRIPFDKADFLMNIPTPFINAAFISGNEGVRIFFVISGFIITMVSLNRYSELRNINAKQFYVFRFARIAPCLIGLLAILTVLHFFEVKGYVINAKFTYSEALFSALTFHLNWLEGMKGYLPPSWDVLWSLSVEEVFYIAFPLVCIISKKKEVLYLVLIALILVGPLNRIFLEGNKVWQTKAYLSCMDSIAVGCLFALVSHKKIISKTAVRVFSVIGFLVVIFVLMEKRGSSFNVLSEYYLFKTLLSVGVGLLLVASVRQQLQPLIRRLLSPLITYGRLSYEIYLTHVFVVLAGISLYRKYDININDSLPWLIGIVLTSGLLAYLVERYFSAPMNSWIRKNYDKPILRTTV